MSAPTAAEAPDPLVHIGPPPMRSAPPQTPPAVGGGRTGARRAIAVPLLVALVFAALQVVAHPNWTLANDSYRYARQSLEILGASPAEARQQAVRAYCADRAAQRKRSRALDPVPAGSHAGRNTGLRTCLRTNAGGLAPTDPRYERIFETRPGYPLLISPAVALIGVARGMWLTGLLLAIGASLLVVAVLRQVGGSPTAAVAGQLLFLSSRLGWWTAQPLAEGAVTVGVLAALLGAWWLLHGRRPAGAGLLLAALGATALVKYSAALTLACALALAAACLLFARPGRPPAAARTGAVPLAALAGASAALIAVGASALRLPDAAESLQDTFSRNFHRALVTDPWQRLLGLDVHYWAQWLRDQAAQPLLPVLLCLAGWALLRRCRVLGVLAAAAAAVGVATAAAHPLVSQQDRLWALLWVPVVLGVPLAVDLLRSGRVVPEPAAPTAVAGAALPRR
ncbi:hypothetical protein [Peterkaempfera bronchialis]|uniref:hypothetical protein n=1 Tax=Peterkaempfera bronchialis TaxID=2126346 RepID=UPI003C2ACFF3